MSKENHFIIDMINLFPDGCSISVSRTKSEDKDNTSIIITGAKEAIPFRISGPDSEINNEAIAKAVEELREAINTVNTNKSQWIEAAREKAEKEEADRVAKSKTTSKPKTKTKAEKEREEAEAEYKKELKQDPDKKMSIADMKKAVKNASTPNIFDNKEPEKKEEKPVETKKDDDQAKDEEMGNTDALVEKQPPVIPDSNDQEELGTIPGTAPKEESEEDKAKEQKPADENKEGGKSFLDLGEWK